MTDLTKRERLARVMCCGASECRADISNRKNIEKGHLSDMPCSAVLYGDEVDAILDELLEPGEGAIDAGDVAIDAYFHGAKDGQFMGSIRACYQAMLTYIKDGKP